MRAARRKRKAFWTPLRIVFVSVVCLITVLVGVNAYYWHVQSPFWKQERAAEAVALEKAGLTDTSSAYKYVWDATTWIVLGEDADGDAAVAWLKEDDSTLVRKKKDGVARADLKEQFFQSKPDADLKHMQVGLLDGEPVWELFYSRDQSGVDMFYYDFYRYNDGGYVVTYNLPKQ